MKMKKQALCVIVCVLTSLILTCYILRIGGAISIILYIIQLIIFFLSIPFLFMKKQAKKGMKKKEE